MSDDNENNVEDVSGDYIKASEVTPDQVHDLPEVPLPDHSVVKSSFLTAIKYRSIEGALSAYRRSINELSAVKDAQAGLYQADVNRQRAIELLRDAHTVHQADKDLRDENAIRAKERREAAEHEAFLAKLEREVEKRYAEEQHERMMRGDGSVEDGKNAQEKAELKERMRARIKAEMEVTLAKEVADELREELNLSPEQDEILEKVIELCGRVSNT